MEAVSYKKMVIDDGIHELGSVREHIFVPSLKLTFNSDWDVWETETLSNTPSIEERYSEWFLKDPRFAQEIAKSKERDRKEVEEITTTVKHITIPIEVAKRVEQLLKLKKLTKECKSLLKTSEVFFKN